MIVHSDIHPTVCRPPGVADRLHHEDSAGLFAPRVASCRLARVKRVHQAQCERAARGLEGIGHGAHDRFTGKDVALHRVVLALDVPCPGARA